MLNIRIAQEHPQFVLLIEGSIDSLNAAQLTQTLSEHLKVGRSRVIANFSGVQYTSSAGLRSLLIALKEARRLGGYSFGGGASFCTQGTVVGRIYQHH